LIWTGREATIEDCQAVLSNLSEITRMGLERAGLTPQEVLEACDELLDKGHGLTVLVDDELAGVFFWHWADDEVPPVIETNSLWTPLAFGRAGRFLAVSFRNYLKKLQNRYPDAIISAFSHSPHPDLERWFKAIGFGPVAYGGEDGRLFAFGVEKSVGNC
jgi:hypothetical protein